jgi:DUF1365 family protein
MSPNSPHAIYEGWVQHRRSVPMVHEFRYRINFWYVDLDEIATAFRGRWFWSGTGPAPVWLRRQDHLGDPKMPLADAVRQLVAEHGITEVGPVRLLTQPRYFGFVMNPVSFYFCFDATGEQLRAVVAEVHNTPWGEEHCYVLPVDETEAWLDKEFHVSPFMPMDLRYRFELTSPQQTLSVRIENHRTSESGDDEEIFSANLQLQRRPWTAWELHRALWLYPFTTQRIWAGIYWQALRLWWKGAPYFAHPGGLRTSTATTSKSTLTPTATIPAKEKLACSDPG